MCLGACLSRGGWQRVEVGSSACCTSEQWIVQKGRQQFPCIIVKPRQTHPESSCCGSYGTTGLSLL